MHNLINDLKRGRTATWVVASTLGYVGVGFVLLEGLLMSSRILRFPSALSTIALLAGLAALPLAPIAGIFKARSVRKGRIEEATPAEEAETRIRRLEEERDFYQSLAEGKERDPIKHS